MTPHIVRMPRMTAANLRGIDVGTSSNSEFGPAQQQLRPRRQLLTPPRCQLRRRLLSLAGRPPVRPSPLLQRPQSRPQTDRNLSHQPPLSTRRLPNPRPILRRAPPLALRCRPARMSLRLPLSRQPPRGRPCASARHFTTSPWAAGSTWLSISSTRRTSPRCLFGCVTIQNCSNY